MPGFPAPPEIPALATVTKDVTAHASDSTPNTPTSDNQNTV